MKENKNENNYEKSFKEHFDDFIIYTDKSRAQAQVRRDYRDLKQWTSEEASLLEERGQAAIVFDQFGKKIDALTGLEQERSTNPRATPATPKHQDSADAITKALQYVERANDFDEIAAEVLEDKLVEGEGAAIVEIDPKKGKVIINRVPWDRFYYDPHSRKKDYSDAKYLGITVWMDSIDAKRKFKSKSEDIEQAFSSSSIDGDSFDDRPNNWVNQQRKRIRVNQEYFLDAGTWKEVWYSGDIVLKDPIDSPYLDCDGDPQCPIEAQCDYIDQENNRYGWSERLKDVQDEINHRRSKALWMLSNYTVVGDLGAFGKMTPEEVLDELSKGKSYLGKMPGAEVDIQYQSELGQTQLGFYQDAQAAMDSVGINPELSGQVDGQASGIALQRREATGMREISRVLARHRMWKRRVFRQVWARIKQFWDEEKWINVTDNPDAPEFVGLNIPVTMAEKMLEQQSGMSIDDIRNKAGREQVDTLIQQLVQGNPQLGQVVETRNNIPELDMDITIDETSNTANTQEEQFQMLAQLAGTRADPIMFEAMLRLSSMPNKEEILSMLGAGKDNKEQQQAAQQQQAQLEQAMIQMEMATKQADIQNTNADTALKEAQAKKAIADALDKINTASQITLPSQ